MTTPRSPEIMSHSFADGTALRTLRWPASSPSGDVLLIQHGLGEHGGRYQTWADALAEESLEIISFDARGHGASGGPRGHAEQGLFTLANDLAHVLAWVKERPGVTRIFLAGHSLGAAVVLTYLTSRIPDPAIAAVIISAPPILVPQSPVLRLKLAAGRVLHRLMPGLTMPTGLAPEAISAVKEEVERYRNDPLVHALASVSLGVGAVDQSAKLPQVSDRITLPLLIVQGDADPLVDVEGTRRLVRALKNANVTYREFKGGMHELHHDAPERRQELFALLRNWLGARRAA